MNHVIPFLIFVLLMTATPGPGNLAMMTIGQTQGFRRAIPFLMGSAIGFNLVCWFTALGLSEILSRHPFLKSALLYAGCAYICYLGWKILRTKTEETGRKEVPGFLNGLMLHPLSPKSWGMCIVGFSQIYSTDNSIASMLLFIAAFSIGQISFHSLWCLTGSFLLRLLKQSYGRAVSFALVCLMISSTAYALIAS